MSGKSQATAHLVKTFVFEQFVDVSRLLLGIRKESTFLTKVFFFFTQNLMVGRNMSLYDVKKDEEKGPIFRNIRLAVG